MKLVRPKNLGASASKLPLTPEEGFVLSRIDSKVSVKELVQLTGLAPERVEQIVAKLETHGAIDVEAAPEPPPAQALRPSTKMHVARSAPMPKAEQFGPGTTSLEDFAAVLGMTGSAPEPAKAAPAPAPAPPPPPKPAAPVIEEGTASLDDFAVALGLAKTVPEAPAVVTAAPAAAPVVLDPVGIEEGTASLDEFAEALGLSPSSMNAPRPEPVDTTSMPPSSAAPPSSSTGATAAAPAADELEEVAELEEVTDENAPAPPMGDEEGEPPKEEIEAAEKSVAEKERNYRQLYETKWHTMTADARVGNASKASGSDLFALCFDVDPKVISAILENPQVGLDHVRLIALHHRTTTGIEILSRRAEWLRDILVERRLLRNPQIGDIVLAKVMNNKRIGQTYRICIDREIPEMTRAKSRGHLRKKWQSAAPEDRADLVIRTEARCLTLLTGCTFDARTTQILCGRPYNSVLFIQNLAKFGATPPGLLAHLVKQPFVRKIAPLKKLLLQHPNMPGEVKRSI